MSLDILGKTKNALYWNVIIKIPSELFRFIISIFMARILEPKDFGIVSIASMLIYYTNTLTNLGFNKAIVQTDNINNKHINSIFIFDLTISLIFYGLFYISAPYIASYFHSNETKSVIRVLSSMFIITTFHEIPHSILRRNIEFKIISLIDNVRDTLMGIISLSFALFGFGYWSMVIGQLISYLLATLYLLYKAKWIPSFIYNHKSLKELLNFGVWNFLNSQIYFLSTRLDRLIIGRYLNITALGYYDKSKSFSQMPDEAIAGNINTVMFSSFSRIKNDSVELKRMLGRGITIMACIFFPVYFGLFAIAPYFILTLLGEKWEPMIIPFKYLCIGCLFSTFNGLFEVFIIGIGDYKKYVIRKIFATMTLCVLCIYFVKIGIEYVAIGYNVYILIVFYFSIIIISKHIVIDWKYVLRCIYIPLLSSIVMVIIIYTSQTMLLIEINSLNMAIMIVLGISTYLIAILIYPSSNVMELLKIIVHDLSEKYSSKNS